MSKKDIHSLFDPLSVETQALLKFHTNNTEIPQRPFWGLVLRLLCIPLPSAFPTIQKISSSPILSDAQEAFNISFAFQKYSAINVHYKDYWCLLRLWIPQVLQWSLVLMLLTGIITAACLKRYFLFLILERLSCPRNI